MTPIITCTVAPLSLVAAMMLALPVAAAQGSEDIKGEWSQVLLPASDGSLEGPPGGATGRFVVTEAFGVRANFGCNQYNTRVTVEGDNATFGRAMSTKKDCGPELGEYEKRASAAMRATKSYEVREGQIAFLDEAGQVVLQIAR